MNAKRNNSYESGTWIQNPTNIVRLVGAGILSLVILTIACKSYFIVDSGFTAVLTQFGEVDQEVYGPGFHTKWFWKGKEEFRTATSTFTLPNLECATGKGQSVKTTITVKYRINPVTLPEIRRQHRFENWEERILQPEALGVIKNAASQYAQIETLLQERTILGEKAKQELTAIIFFKLSVGDDASKRLASHDVSWKAAQPLINNPNVQPMIIVESFILNDLSPHQKFRDAVEEKQAADQRMQKAKYDQERLELEGKGEADKAIAIAEGEAQRIERLALANANALQSLADKWMSFEPDVRRTILQQMAIERWNQKLPDVWSSNTSPLQWYQGWNGEKGTIMPLNTTPEDKEKSE